MLYSNTEFYYAHPENISTEEVVLGKEEAKHVTQVMRHSQGEIIKIADGNGNIYSCELLRADKKSAILKIIKKDSKKEIYPNITVYIPILKSSDRLEFALEKCVELGITNFVIYSSEKSYKRGIKLERINKILLSAMKQSLNAVMPKIEILNELKSEISKLKNCVLFDQQAELHFSQFLSSKSYNDELNLFIGPEGGFSDNEMNLMGEYQKVYISTNRLRTETAVVAAASFLSDIKK